MMIEIGIERHSDSWVLRSAKGERQGNAVTVIVSQMIVSGLEHFSPLNFVNLISGLDKESCAFCKQKARSMQCTHGAKRSSECVCWCLQTDALGTTHSKVIRYLIRKMSIPAFP